MPLPLSDRPAARAVLRVDAAVEALLALVCLVLALRAAGTAGWVLPPWLGAPALVAVAVVLVVVAVVLWRLARRPAVAAVRAVATANAVTAAVFLVWAGLGLGAGPELRVLAGLTAAALVALATAQFAVTRAR